MALRRARTGGIALLCLQFVGLCIWSGIEAHRGGLTNDFSIFEQAATLISHGHLDPYSTVKGYYFVQDHSFLLMWPISIVYLVWPHPVTLLVIQNAALVGAEAIAFSWICEVVAHRQSRMTGGLSALILLGAFLLVANPWFVWAESFDFHTEAFATMFALGTAYNLARGRRRVWIFVLLGLACGDVGGTYELFAGLSALLTRRVNWRTSLAIVVLSIVWVVLLGTIGGTRGSSVSGIYPQLVSAGHRGSIVTLIGGILRHPGTVLSTLWSNRLAAWSNIAPSGVIGLVWLPVMVPSILVLAEGQFSPLTDFSLPGFQQLAVYLFVAVGSIAILTRLSVSQRRATRWFATALALLTVINAAGWLIVWLPRAGTRWLRVSSPAAAVIRELESRIPSSAEVIAQQGVSGDFSARKTVYASFEATMNYPVRARQVWIVFTPRQGIEPGAINQYYQDIGLLSQRRGVKLVVDRAGVIAFDWTPPPTARRLVVSPSASDPVPAWATVGIAGVSVRNGPEPTWYVASTGGRGYVIDHAYWRESPGRYQATVRLLSTGEAKIELWNATTNTLLARADVPGASQVQSVSIEGALHGERTEQIFAGWGPWRTRADPPRGNQLEVRVWEPGGNDEVNVFSVHLAQSH